MVEGVGRRVTLIIIRFGRRVLLLVVVGGLAPHRAQGLHRGSPERRLLHADVGGGGGPVEDLRGGAQVGLPVLVRERGGRRRRGRGRGGAHRVSRVDDGLEAVGRRRGKGEGDEARDLKIFAYLV